RRADGPARYPGARDGNGRSATLPARRGRVMTANAPAAFVDDLILADHAAMIRMLGRRVVEDVIEIGRRLTICRDILKEDGRWRAWLEGELRLSPQSAGRFIQTFELSQTCSNLERVDLPLSAVYLIAAPSCPPEARAEIIERAQGGEQLPV